MPKLDIYNISKLGVNVDKAQPFLEDGELTKAQNAIRDGIGEDGGLRKRPGLLEFNGSAAAGSIVGGIGVPLFRPVTRTLFMAQNVSGGGGSSWLQSTNDGSSWTVVSTSAGVNPISIRGYSAMNASFQSVFAGVPAITWKNSVYYCADTGAGSTYGVNTSGEDPQIRVFNGTVDKLLAKIPSNPTVGFGTFAFTVTSLYIANGLIYVATFDGAPGGIYTDTTNLGRVFSLDPNTGLLIQIGATFPAGYLPYAMAWHAGRLWVGTNRGTTSSAGRIYWFRPGIDTAWTLDHTTTAGQGNIVSLSSYNGELFAGISAEAGTSAIVKKRSLAGVWSTVETAGGTGNFNGYYALAVFNGNLYAAYSDYVGGSMLVRKYNGTSWSTAYTGSGATLELFQSFTAYNQKLYAVPAYTTAQKTFLRTPDGTTWTALAISGSSSTLALTVIET